MIRSTRAFAFVLGSSLLLAGAPALADQAGSGDTGGSTIGESDRTRELDTDRQREDMRDDTVLGEPTDRRQPDPTGTTGQGTAGDDMGTGRGRTEPGMGGGAPGTGTGTGTDRQPGDLPGTGTGTGTGGGPGTGGMGGGMP
ncbi:MAG: hypothetical protein DCC71_09095 [Proteobacteria bacterium]|nr:MAG: hypothetical protein DCC71_09095 [Pseudomonadota bacterium]